MASINEKNLKLGDKRKFQLILVGYDRTKEGNEAYLKDGKLSWPGVKLAGRKSLQDLLKKGETGFIPNLVLLKPDGTMESNDRGAVLQKLDKLASAK